MWHQVSHSGINDTHGWQVLCWFLRDIVRHWAIVECRNALYGSIHSPDNSQMILDDHRASQGVCMKFIFSSSELAFRISIFFYILFSTWKFFPSTKFSQNFLYYIFNLKVIFSTTYKIVLKFLISHFYKKSRERNVLLWKKLLSRKCDMILKKFCIRKKNF